MPRFSEVLIYLTCHNSYLSSYLYNYFIMAFKLAYILKMYYKSNITIVGGLKNNINNNKEDFKDFILDFNIIYLKRVLNIFKEFLIYFC